MDKEKWIIILTQKTDLSNSPQVGLPPAIQDMNFDNYRKFTHQELMQELSKPPKYHRFKPH